MRKLTYLLVAFVSLGLVAAKGLVTESQETTAGVLSALNFKQLPVDPKKPGSPPSFTVTEETLEFLKKYEGKTIEVADDGSLEIEEN